MICPAIQCFEAVAGRQKVVEGGGGNAQGNELRGLIGHLTGNEDMHLPLGPRAWFCPQADMLP